MPVDKMSFSQRRFNGFRGQTEFDKKRILVCGPHSFSIYGVDALSGDISYKLLHEDLG